MQQFGSYHVDYFLDCPWYLLLMRQRQPWRRVHGTVTLTCCLHIRKFLTRDPRRVFRRLLNNYHYSSSKNTNHPKLYSGTKSVKMNTSSILAATLLVVILFHSTSAFDIQDCSSGVKPAKLKVVTISNCADAKGDYCILERGSNASIKIDFEASKYLVDVFFSI